MALPTCGDHLSPHTSCVCPRSSAVVRACPPQRRRSPSAPPHAPASRAVPRPAVRGCFARGERGVGERAAAGPVLRHMSLVDSNKGGCSA